MSDNNAQLQSKPNGSQEPTTGKNLLKSNHCS